MVAPFFVSRIDAPLTLASTTSTETETGTAITGLIGMRDLIVTLKVTSAERDSADETYNFYITSGDGVSEWDIVSFPQIATTGAKTYTAIVCGSSRPTNTTTAGPGVEAVTTSTLKTDTAGADQGIGTLGAGYVRHGAFGDRINYKVVIAGTVTTGIAYTITITPKG